MGGIYVLKKLIFISALIIIGILSLFISVPSLFESNNEQIEVTDGIEAIEIDVQGVNTIIIPKNQNSVKADVDGKGNVSVTKQGNTIEVEYDRKWFEQIFSFFDRTQLTVTIPENFNRDLKLEVGSGNIHFQEAAEQMQLRQFDVEIGSGNVKIDSLSADMGEFEVSSGNLNIKQYSGQLEAEVSSGNLTVQMETLTAPIQADVSSGHLTLDLPDDADFTLDGKVSSGRILNNFTLQESQETKNSLRGTFGSGKHSIDLDVSSGVIELK